MDKNKGFSEYNEKESTEMIQCKSIYESAEDGDGIRINVARFIPRTIRENVDINKWDLHLPCVAPSQDLLQPFKNKEIKFPIFIKKYLAEMKGAGAQIGLKTIGSLSLCGAITLLCYEKTDTFCHRRFISDIVTDVLRKINNDFERLWRFNVATSIEVLENRYAQKIKEVEDEIAKAVKENDKKQE